MTTLKLRKVGNSVGVVLPKEVLAKLRASEGDELRVTDTENGITLSLNDKVLSAQMEAARYVMKKRRAVLRELAK